jgi:hypothetical protein
MYFVYIICCALQSVTYGRYSIILYSCAHNKTCSYSRLWSSGLQHCVILYVDTNVWEEYAIGIFTIEACTGKNRLDYMDRFARKVITQIHEIPFLSLYYCVSEERGGSRHPASARLSFEWKIETPLLGTSRAVNWQWRRTSLENGLQSSRRDATTIKAPEWIRKDSLSLRLKLASFGRVWRPNVRQRVLWYQLSAA